MILVSIASMASCISGFVDNSVPRRLPSSPEVEQMSVESLLLWYNHLDPSTDSVWSYESPLLVSRSSPSYVQTPPGPRCPGFNSLDHVISPFHDAKEDAQVRARLRLRKTRPPLLLDITAE